MAEESSVKEESRRGPGRPQGTKRMNLDSALGTFWRSPTTGKRKRLPRNLDDSIVPQTRKTRTYNRRTSSESTVDSAKKRDRVESILFSDLSKTEADEISTYFKDLISNQV